MGTQDDPIGTHARSQRLEWHGSSGNRLVGEAFEAPGQVSALLLHGGGQTRHTWRRAARRLQAAGIPCLTFDLRGHGESAWDSEGDYRLDAFLADARIVLADWDRPVVLIGTSLGGLVALMTAGSGAAGVRGLAMIDTAPQLNPAEITWLLEFLSGESERGFESPAAAADHVRRFFPDLAVSAESMEKSLRLGPDGRWHHHWDVRVVVGERNSVALGHEQRLHDDASRVSVPFALVRAGASHLVSDEAVEQLRARVPHLEVYDLPGAHHLFNSEESLQIMDILGDFLRRTAG
jgi:non-heme chloroperoxidase